jgi:DNA mismatch endonuclease, patch repair protein
MRRNQGFDVFTREKRSQVMSRIRSSGNRDTELRMIAMFRAHGITGWRRSTKLVGKPDFVFRRERVVIFVDGCFWHGCPQPKHSPMPKGNAEFWAKKLSLNKARDRFVTRTLRHQDWKVLRVWEHDLNPSRQARSVARIGRALGR